MRSERSIILNLITAAEAAAVLSCLFVEGWHGLVVVLVAYALAFWTCRGRLTF